MSKFITSWNTTAEYDAVKDSLATPQVALTKDNNTVHYKPIDPYVGHDYVEIGGLKWATMNIGAELITDNGLYFQWGDTQGYTASEVGSGEGQKYFSWASYKFNPSGDGSTFTKYNSTDGKTVLEAEDDAARANWGGSWRMPTWAEFQTLGTICSTAWTTTYEGSASGMLLTVTADTADNGKQLFFPAAGYCSNDKVWSVGASSGYFSSSIYFKYNNSASHFAFTKNGINYSYYDVGRYYGNTIRPVMDA